MTDLARETVETWIRQLESTPREIDDPNTNWHLTFDYPSKSPSIMHAVQPTGRSSVLALAYGVDVAHEHLEAFDELDADSRKEFLWDLRHSINVVDVDFKLEGREGNGGCPKHIQVSVTRYVDGLNMDSFAQSAGAIYKTFLNAVWTVQRHLGEKNFGPGGRFDFKKLGY